MNGDTDLDVGLSRGHPLELEYRMLLDKAVAALAVVGSDGIIEYANPRAAALAEAGDPSELIGLHLNVLTAPEWRKDLAQLLRGFEADDRTQETLLGHGMGMSLAGNSFHVELSVNAVEFAHSRAMLVQAIDMTRQVGAEAEARAQAERLRALKSELVSIEERNRMAAARALHDNVGQPLAMARMAIQSYAAEAEVSHEDLDRALRLLDVAIGETRHLTTELVPQLLRDFGTASAIRRLAEEIESSYGLRVFVEGKMDDAGVSEEARAVFFRSVREILINVAKHAGVDEARVTLSESERGIRVQVADDGVGFDPKVRNLGRTFGLFSIDERLPLLGGSMVIDSAPGRGCRVTLTIARNVVT